MQFAPLIPANSPLANLLQRSRYWQQLDAAAKRLLPANLHPHFRVACIEEGALIIHVSAPMAATRLKMLLPSLLPQLQELDPDIARIQIKTRPHNPAAAKSKNFHLSERALNSFEQTAKKLPTTPNWLPRCKIWSKTTAILTIINKKLDLNQTKSPWLGA